MGTRRELLRSGACLLSTPPVASAGSQPALATARPPRTPKRDPWLSTSRDSRLWNAFSGMTTILKDGDLPIGGAFGGKRVIA
jgi:hypothetical protein